MMILSTTTQYCQKRMPDAVMMGVGSQALRTTGRMVASTIRAAVHDTVRHWCHCFTVPKKQSSNRPQ